MKSIALLPLSCGTLVRLRHHIHNGRQHGEKEKTCL
jgi:hypothetical protein